MLAHNVVINAGLGGDSTRRTAGAGGFLNSVIVENSDVQTLLINSGNQGNGGNSSLGKGGKGGEVRNVIVIDTDSGNGLQGAITLRSGNGGDGATGGAAGGAIIKSSVTALNSNVFGQAGEGGDATVKGKGGAGGALTKVRLTGDGQVAGSFVTGSLTAGVGGAGLGAGGKGGGGGTARLVSINMDGDTVLTAGKGGNGQLNFYNSQGTLKLGGAPGKGGDIQVSGLFAVNGSGTLRAGDAGDNGNKPAAGGSISGGANNALVGLRAAISISAKGGNGTHGGAGGSVSSLAYGSTADSLTPTPSGNILIQAGNGSVEGKAKGAGGSLKLIDGSVSSAPNSTTTLLAGDGGGIENTNLPVTTVTVGGQGASEVQVIDLSALAGIAKSRFSLTFGPDSTPLLVASTLNVRAIQAALDNVLGQGVVTASLNPTNPSLLRIEFSTPGNQPLIAATGYNGGVAGKGGSVTNVSVFLGGGAGVEFRVEAGDGGSAAVNGKTGGNGGSISGVGVAGLDFATIVRSFGAGDGGDARKFGGLGGSVTSVAVQDHDIGLRSGVAFGYESMGGIFAGTGGAVSLVNGKAGKAGSVQNINANSIAAIVAGKTLVPQLATKVSEIYLNDDVQLVTRVDEDLDPSLGRALVSNSPFSLSFGGDTTPLLPGNATVAQVQAALNLLPAVQATGVIGAPLSISETTPGSAAQAEVQTIGLGASGGAPQCHIHSDVWRGQPDLPGKCFCRNRAERTELAEFGARSGSCHRYWEREWSLQRHLWQYGQSAGIHGHRFGVWDRFCLVWLWPKWLLHREFRHHRRPRADHRGRAGSGRCPHGREWSDRAFNSYGTHSWFAGRWGWFRSTEGQQALPIMKLSRARSNITASEQIRGEHDVFAASDLRGPAASI